ncbi:MAG TPA: hypothetical protein VMZ27_03505 [Candidatus Saccharimonadales bacterium]|nr:hypothetical protein [Candidatus Saccharimonadales bacterium]
MASTSALSIVWFIWNCWVPVIKEAIRSLPAEGTIENQQLKLRAETIPLAQNRLFGIAADPQDKGSQGLASDLTLELGKDRLRICFLLGCKTLPYPKGGTFEFNRPELEPRWEAWQPILLAGLGAAAWIFIFVSWLLLGLFYLPFALLAVRWKGKENTVGGTWRLIGAALMPGAALLTIGMVCYGLGLIDSIRLFTLTLLHIVLGWVYLAMALRSLPQKVQKTDAVNPFAPGTVSSSVMSPEPKVQPSPQLSEEQPGSSMDNPS